jgi:hypothetical protein
MIRWPPLTWEKRAGRTGLLAAVETLQSRDFFMPFDEASRSRDWLPRLV